MENPEKSAMIVMHCSPGHSAEVRSDSLSMSFCRPMVLTSFVRCLQRKKTSGVPSRAKPRKCMRLVLMKGQRSCAVIGSSLLRKVSSTLTMSMAASTSCFLAIRKRASCTSDLPGYLFFIIVSFPASTFCRMLFAGDDCCSSMICSVVEKRRPMDCVSALELMLCWSSLSLQPTRCSRTTLHRSPEATAWLTRTDGPGSAPDASARAIHTALAQ
mmetsp:Transcript_34746/g.82416  ORF Transcript_34746/g.82416 Transcript_34746/m.82416 type:complete len:214 (+) Transcript_34746:587-1228(+)